MKLPGPREKLASCVWLPRILAKARFLAAGSLPENYAARFCHPQGVDGAFLTHFGLSREEIISAAELSDERAAEWFLARCDSESIERWNHTAVNLGRSGYPMAERLPIALATTYKNVAERGPTTVFEVLEADEENG